MKNYFIHIYGTDVAGNTAWLGATTIDMEQRDYTPPTVSSFNVSVAGSNGEGRQIIMNMQDQSGIKSVRAAVWSAVYGQGDLIWYDATLVSGNQWSIVVPFINHGDEGDYYVHVYATDAAGNTGFAGNTSFNVPSATYSSDDTANIYYYTSFVNFWTYNITCNYGVKEVWYNVYTDSGEDIWVQANYSSYLTSGYIYYTAMNNYRGPAYNDVWIVDNRDIIHYLGTWSFNM